MAESTIAFRYAKSLLDLATEKAMVEELHNDMELVRQTIEQNRPLSLMLKNPIVRTEKKAAVLTAIFGHRVNALTNAFITIILKKNREAILEAIGQEYNRLYNEQHGIVNATVITTTPLTDALRKKMTATVTGLTGSQQVQLAEKLDEKLIGGYVLRVGDQQVDASIRNQLNELRLKFLN